MRKKSLRRYFREGRSEESRNRSSIMDDPIWAVTLARRKGRPERSAVEVDGESGCVVWQGADNRNRHGMYDGSPVYRSYYIYFRGPIPEGLDLHHVCHNPMCVNPKHLVPMSREENRGVKLSLADAIAIHERADQGIPAAEIAAEFKVSTSHVYGILAGSRWAAASSPRASAA